LIEVTSAIGVPIQTGTASARGVRFMPCEQGRKNERSVKSTYIDEVLKLGTIRISTLSHFRKLERKPWIADPNEATTIVDASGATITSGPGQTISDTWTPPGFGTSAASRDGGTICFTDDAKLSYRFPDCYIFCLSFGEKKALIQAMCVDACDPYDAAVRISVPLGLLAHRMFYRGVVEELNNEPVRRLFVEKECDQVTYREIVHHHSAGVAEPPSPFVKERRFAAQSEARIVLHPRLGLARDWLTIRLSEPEKIFVEEFRTEPT
jgi:hypothetical protein